MFSFSIFMKFSLVMVAGHFLTWMYQMVQSKLVMWNNFCFDMIDILNFCVEFKIIKSCVINYSNTLLAVCLKPLECIAVVNRNSKCC